MKIKVKSVRSDFYSVSYESSIVNAMFCFDLTNYTLIVVSNRENYVGRWGKNEKPFLTVISTVNRTEFLSKIAKKSTYDKLATWKNIKKYLFNVLDGKSPDFPLSEIEDCCYDCCTGTTLCSEIYDILTCSGIYNMDSDVESKIAEAIVPDYDRDAYLIAEIFEKHIKPYIDTCISESNDSTNDWLDKEIEVDGVTCYAIVCPHCMTFFNSAMMTYGNYCPNCGAKMIHTTK